MADIGIRYASDNQGVIIDPTSGVPTPFQLTCSPAPIGYKLPACTIKNLRVRVNSFAGFGPVTGTFEIFKDGLPTGLKVTGIAAPGEYSDLVNMVVFAAGEHLDLTFTPSVFVAAAGPCAFSATVERF